MEEAQLERVTVNVQLDGGAIAQLFDAIALGRSIADHHVAHAILIDVFANRATEPIEIE